jgi:AcrR family transcriptional regulator
VDHEEASRRLLDAADSLYYARGIQAVGIDEVRSAAGVSLTRLYQLFPSKQHLVAAYLRRRDQRWRASLAHYVSERQHEADPREPLLAVFNWLEDWFREPDFRGCAFINAFGELGTDSDLVVDAVREHKALFRQYLVELADDLTDADDPTAIADQLLLLAEGATTTAAITGSPYAARAARAAATALLATTTASPTLNATEPRTTHQAGAHQPGRLSSAG